MYFKLEFQKKAFRETVEAKLIYKCVTIKKHFYQDKSI